jgi:hypothetical protein
MATRCRPCSHRDVVEEAEAHRLVAGRMMSGRPDQAERVGHAAGDHVLGRGHGRARGVQRGVERGRAGHRVGVEVAALAAGSQLPEQVDQLCHVAGGVSAADLLGGGGPGLAPVQEHVQPRGAQVVGNGIQALGTLRMACAHVMAAAGRMAVQSGIHR